MAFTDLERNKKEEDKRNQECLQEIIGVLKNWQNSKKENKDLEAAISKLPLIKKTYDIFCKSKGQSGAKTTDALNWLGSAARDGSGYYPALLNELASPEVIADLEDWSRKPAETEQKAKGSKIMITARASKEIWEDIRSQYDISKIDFAKKIKFVKDKFKKNVIFRDIEHAFVLSTQGFPKPAVILAGGVIEELLRLYLKRKRIKPKDETFFSYIKACEDNRLLKRGVYRLSDSIRDFRNLVHLKNETIKKHTVSTATAKGAVSSIFTIANDFQ